MEALRKGTGQEAFLATLEEKIDETPNSEWDNALQRNSTDKAWDILAGALRDSTFGCFPGASFPKPDFEEDRNTRLQLLKDRGKH